MMFAKIFIISKCIGKSLSSMIDFLIYHLNLRKQHHRLQKDYNNNLPASGKYPSAYWVLNFNPFIICASAKPFTEVVKRSLVVGFCAVVPAGFPGLRIGLCQWAVVTIIILLFPICIQNRLACCGVKNIFRIYT